MSLEIKNKFTFIDLFAGIGGFHLAMHNVGGECVFASEWDKYARITYEANFKSISPKLFEDNNFNVDINDANPDEIKDFQVLCAGFPCQPFSHAGLKKGFADTRGTLFFNIEKIIEAKVNKGKPPKVILLENVKGLRNHDGGNTLRIIKEKLEGLGYIVEYEVLNSKYFGVPQNRERIFIVAWLDIPGAPFDFNFPYGLYKNGRIIYKKEDLGVKSKNVTLGKILLKNVNRKYTISNQLFEGHKRRLREHREKGNGFGFMMFNSDSPYTSTISARYYKDGSEIMIQQDNDNPRKLHPKEAGRLQGYPLGKKFKIVVSDVQAYKQFGNSVTLPVVSILAKEIKNQLLNKYET